MHKLFFVRCADHNGGGGVPKRVVFGPMTMGVGGKLLVPRLVGSS